MLRHVPIALLATALLLPGCASTPGGKTETSAPKPAAPAADERLVPPVSIPAAAKRKVVLSMTGPKNVVEASDWAEFRNEWRSTFGDYAREAGIDFSFVDGVAQPTGEDGTMLLVTVNDYRMQSIGSRIFFGSMKGNAYIDARLQYASLRDGATFGEKHYQTTSSFWGGAFSKATPQQVDAIGNDAFADLRAAK